MAPISTALLGWAISEQPEAAFLSLIILFIASIALLALCASCKKHSFELESSSAPEQKSSTLVSVARISSSSVLLRTVSSGDSRFVARKDNSTGARHNHAASEITGDEIGLESEDVTISQEGIVYKPWRSHTLTHGSNPPTQINGSVGTTNEGSVTLHAI